MSSESILDLDEARRRLQQIDREHTDVLQLVAKLREVHRSLESHVRLLEDRAESAEDRLTRLRALVRTLRNRGIRLQSASDQALADLEHQRVRVAESCDSLRSSLEQLHAQWCGEQHARIEAAAQQHQDSLAACARSWEQDLGQLRTELAALRDEMQQRLGLLSDAWKRELAVVSGSFEARLQAQLTDANREVDRDLVSVRQEVQSLVDRRTYVAAAAIGLSLFLAAFGLMGRTSPSVADDQRVERQTAAGPIAGTEPAPSRAPTEPRESATRSAADGPVRQERTHGPLTEVNSTAEQGAESPAPGLTPPVPTTPPASPPFVANEPHTPRTPEPGARTRVWTDHLGRWAEADFEDFRDGIVYLRGRTTGRVHPIPLEQLSVPDQAYVRGLLAWRR